MTLDRLLTFRTLAPLNYFNLIRKTDCKAKRSWLPYFAWNPFLVRHRDIR